MYDSKFKEGELVLWTGIERHTEVLKVIEIYKDNTTGENIYYYRVRNSSGSEVLLYEWALSPYSGTAFLKDLIDLL